jgi:hypothetical protein
MSPSVREFSTELLKSGLANCNDWGIHESWKKTLNVVHGFGSLPSSSTVLFSNTPKNIGIFLLDIQDE